MTVKEIIPLQAGDGIEVCPDCGYDRGFNVTFINAAGAKSTPVRSTREVFRAILTCPGCGARFDVGWRVSFSEFRSAIKTTVRAGENCVHHANPRGFQPARLSDGRHPPV